MASAGEQKSIPVGRIRIPERMIPDRPGLVAVGVGDNRMAPQICKGATVVIDTRNCNPRPGQVAAVVLENEAFLAKYYMRGGHVELERPACPTLEVAPSVRFQVLGVYEGHWTPA